MLKNIILALVLALSATFASAAEWALKAMSQPDYCLDRELRKRAHCRRVDASMLLAMSKYQLHQLDEARAAFTKGLEIAHERLPKLERADLGEFWDEWVFAQVLMREAKALIEGGSQAGGETKSYGVEFACSLYQ